MENKIKPQQGEYIEHDNPTGIAQDDTTESDLNLIIKPISERRMELLKEMKIETDEDYNEMGKMFDEDE